MRLILADHPAGQESDQQAGPSRRCLVMRVSLPKERMLRFVVGPEDHLIFDVASTLPGRGLWLSAGRNVVEMALKRGVFTKAAKQRIVVPDGLADQITVLLERRISELLGLTRRSGAALPGFEKVREMIGAGRCVMLIEARDGSLAERSRLLNGRDIPVFTPLDAARLGAVFGRDAVTHVGVAAGRLAAMLGIEATRLACMNDKTLADAAIAIPGKSGQRDARLRLP